jgi:hypothetical protein
MSMLSDDDLDLANLDDEELAAAWDLWFDLAQTTNPFDPPYCHGVFVGLRAQDVGVAPEEVAPDR